MNDGSNSPIPNMDYKIISGSEYLTVKILTGEFRDIEYVYSNVSLSLDNDDPVLPPVLSFDFDIIDSGQSLYSKSEIIDSDFYAEFVELIGDILSDILIRS